MTAVVVLACLLAEAAVGYYLWGRLNRVRRLWAECRRVGCLLAEAERVVRAREEVEASRERVEQRVDLATASVETIHHAVADVSFDLSGSRDTNAREIHDRTADQVYGGIRSLNRGTGRLLSGLLGQRRHTRRK